MKQRMYKLVVEWVLKRMYPVMFLNEYSVRQVTKRIWNACSVGGSYSCPEGKFVVIDAVCDYQQEKYLLLLRREA